jgi:protein-tyrosine phosphatase
MRSSLYWIDIKMPGRLAIMPRPRAGDWLVDEIAGWRGEGVDIVVSLLEAEEVGDLELIREAALCGAQRIDFVSFPVRDRGVPASLPETMKLVRRLAAEVAAGKAVAVHCRAGIGRSATIAACVLALSGFDADSAFAAIAAARGLVVPETEAQRQWVVAFESYAAAR